MSPIHSNAFGRDLALFGVIWCGLGSNVLSRAMLGNLSHLDRLGRDSGSKVSAARKSTQIYGEKWCGEAGEIWKENREIQLTQSYGTYGVSYANLRYFTGNANRLFFVILSKKTKISENLRKVMNTCKNFVNMVKMRDMFENRHRPS